MKKILVVLLMVVGLFPSAPPANAAGCPSSIWSTLYPGQCILEYSDEAKAISGTSYQLQPDLNSCADYFAGVKISTGYDRVSYVRVVDVPTSGEIKSNQNVKVEVSISENCRAWAKSYLVNGEMVFADGSKVPILFTETDFRYREKFTGSIESYCFTNICASSTLTGTFSTSNAPQGSATLNINIDYNQSSASSIQLTPISAKYKYSNVFYIGASAPAPSKKTQAITVIRPQNISISAKTYPLTAFVTSNLGMTIDMNTPSVCNFSNGAFTLLSVGTCKSTLNQAGDDLWEPAAPLNLEFEILPANLTVVKKSTITCVKGKLVKKVTAVKPVCPAGYKKK